jgi:hypothetical protein
MTRVLPGNDQQWLIDREDFGHREQAMALTVSPAAHLSMLASPPISSIWRTGPEIWDPLTDWLPGAAGAGADDVLGEGLAGAGAGPD